MKIIVSKSSLEDCVKNLVKVINPKSELPILGNILFVVNEKAKTAHLTASDSEVTVTYEVILSECEGGGTFCVLATTLAAMLANVREQPLTITATLESDMKFTLTYLDGSAFCPIVTADEYPPFMQGEYKEKIITTGEFVRDALKRSLWATSDNEMRPVMNGVNFALNNGRLDIVASDGHTLVKSSKAEQVAPNRCGSFVMPKKAAKVLIDILEDEDWFEMEWNEREAHFNLTGSEFSFRLIEGKYPDYNSVIPKSYADEATCQRTELLSALKAVAPFTPDSSQLMTLTFEHDRLEVRGEDVAFTEGAVKSISIDGYDGDTMSIGVKASTIIKMLQKLSYNEVLLKINDPSRAIIIEPLDDTSNEITGMIMPMIIND